MVAGGSAGSTLREQSFTISMAFLNYSKYIQINHLAQVINMNKLVFPKATASLTLKVGGVFATPQDWKATDDANPGLFTYTARCLAFEIDKGKIFPKELTQKEQRQLEEKNKKGGKKQSKKEEGNAQEQRLRKQEEEQQRRRQEEWSKLSEEDRKYRDYEDPMRAPQLRFENNSKTELLRGKHFIIFEERVEKDGGQWIYLIKAPAVSEDELAKMRKTKPKTLANINDLNPVVMRAWIDLSALNSSNKTAVTQRCKLQQVDKTPETSQPNLTNTYIKVSLTLDEPLLPKSDGVQAEKMIADPPAGEVESDRVKVVNQLRDQLRLGIESLAMQFSAMFWKELNIYEDFKNINIFMSKKNDITKRKQHFLYDFNVSGKYKILKDRIKKVIVHLCEKYFVEQMGSSKSFTGVSCTIKDQFYSEVYTFLVCKYKQILQELIFEKKEKLNEVEVLSKSAQHRMYQNYLNSKFQETEVETINRVIAQYEILGNYKYGETLYAKFIESNPSNVEVKYSYAMYCIKNRLKTAEEVLPQVEQYLSYNKDDMKVRLEYLLLLVATENEENCKKAWILLRDIIAKNSQSISNLIIGSYIFSDMLGKEDVGEKLAISAQRLALKQLKKVPEDGRHKQASIPSELCTVKGLPSYSESLSQQEKDKLWLTALSTFLQLNLFNIVDKILPKIKSANSSIFEVLKLQNLLNSSQFQEFELKSKQAFAKTKSLQILQLITKYSLQHPNNQTEQFLKTYLIKNKEQKQIQALLKLAFYYLNCKQYANSKACVLKYLEKQPHNSGFSWRILGIAQLNLGNIDQALDSLKKANLLDISNNENWLWLARIFTLKNNFVMTNQCLNQYQIMRGKKAAIECSDIYQQLNRRKAQNLCEQKLRVSLIERLAAKQITT